MICFMDFDVLPSPVGNIGVTVQTVHFTHTSIDIINIHMYMTSIEVELLGTYYL